MARRGRHGSRHGHGIGGVGYKRNKGHHGGVGLDHGKLKGGRRGRRK